MRPDKDLKSLVINILRGLFALSLVSFGAVWFFNSSQDWYQKGFPILVSGEKGKDALSGVFFSVVFIAYGAWEIYRIVKENKA